MSPRITTSGSQNSLQVSVSPAAAANSNGGGGGSGSGGSSQQQQSSSSSSLAARGTNSLETAWRRKIVLNMNLLPHSIDPSTGTSSSNASSAVGSAASSDGRGAHMSGGTNSAHPMREPLSAIRSPMSSGFQAASHHHPRSVRNGGANGGGGGGGGGGSASSSHNGSARPAKSQPHTPTASEHAGEYLLPQLTAATTAASSTTSGGPPDKQPTLLTRVSHSQSKSHSTSPTTTSPAPPGNSIISPGSTPNLGPQQACSDASSSSSSSAHHHASVGQQQLLLRHPSEAELAYKQGQQEQHHHHHPGASPKGHSPSFAGGNQTSGGFAASGVNSNGGAAAAGMNEEQIDWAELCRSLTGEDLDACEADTAIYLKEYYDSSHHSNSGADGSSVNSSMIDTLDGSIRDMESRKAITLRVRQVGWVVSVAFALSGIGAIASMLASSQSYVPIAGMCYILASVLFGVCTPIVGRQTRFFCRQPLLTLSTLQLALNAWAGVTCATLFIGSLALHFNRGFTTSDQTDGWARWVLCCLPAFVGYLHHDLRSPAAKVWTGITGGVLVMSHLLDHYVLEENSGSSGVDLASRQYSWILECLVQLLFLLVHLFFSLASSLSIQSHVVQLWHRERFMLEQGKALAVQREQAFSTANQKSSFLASMSHEIRTPLNGVIGLCSLVLESELTQDQRECLTTVIKSGETLLNIINDVLLFSKLEANELMIEQLPFSPLTAVEDVLDIFALLAQQQEIELIAHFCAGLPCPVWGDVMRLRQILTNLVSTLSSWHTRPLALSEWLIRFALCLSHSLRCRMRSSSVASKARW